MATERNTGPSISEEAMQGELSRLFGNTLEEHSDVADRLETHFGTQKFQYGTHVGTFAEMVASCTAVTDFISQGFEAAVQIVSSYMISEEEYQRAIEDQKQSNKENDERLNSDTEEKDEPAKGETAPEESRAEKKVKEVIGETKGDTEASRAPSAVEETAQDAKEVIVDLKADTNDSTLAPLPDSDAAAPIIKTEAVGDSDTVVSAEIISDTKVEAGVEAQPEASAAIPIELFQSERVVAPAMTVEQNDSTPPIDMIEGIEQETMVEPMDEIETIQPLPVLDTEYAVEESPFNAYIEPPEYVSRGSANELAEQPTVTDAFQIPNEHLLEETPELFAEEQNSVVEVIDVLDESEAEIFSPDEEPVLNHSAIEEVANAEQPVTDEASVLQQAVEHEQTDTEEFEPDEAIEAVIDIIAKIEGEEPEYEAEVNAIEGGRYIKDVAKAVSQLESARTREECQLYLAELRKSLSELFEALGYENAEAMAIRWITLVRQYGTETLKELIATLLQTLAQQNATHFAKTTGQVHKHHWFGQRVVERVVQAIPIVQAA